MSEYQPVPNQQRTQPIRTAVEPGLAYRADGSPHHVVRGLREKRGLVERRGVPESCVWTLREIEDAAGVLWPADPTLGQVLDALATTRRLEGAHE